MGELFFFWRNRWLIFLLKTQWVWEGVSGTTGHKISLESEWRHLRRRLRASRGKAAACGQSNFIPEVKFKPTMASAQMWRRHWKQVWGGHKKIMTTPVMAALLEDVIGQRNMLTWQEWKSRPGMYGLLKRTSPAELVSVFCPKEILCLFVFLQFCLNCLVKFPETFRHLLSSTRKTVSAALRQTWPGML